ncbi:MAG: TonB-dependent receptor [Acidobacteriota bacterium]
MTPSILIWLLASAGTGAQNVVIPPLHQTIVITASPDEPAFDRRDAELFRRTLFSRDDQVLHVLDAGISAGQHEGGGKSVEVRRFGFNLDHGGVNGGLKMLVDNVQQNQGTQGHGQGYLGALKSLIPELVEEVRIINGPFSAEYGDFSGLGVVHIRLRESLPDQWTARFQGGSFLTRRAFLGYSPLLKAGDALVAYEGSRTDGPFQEPLGYARDNVTANLTRRLPSQRSLGFKLNAGRNDFNSSGQLPLDEVSAGRLDPFGSLSAGDGGRGQSGTLGLNYRSEAASGAVWNADAFLARSLLDLYSNFTFFLNNPEAGDALQQHDSRLQQGANLQYLRSHRLAGIPGLLTAGASFHDNQINVGLYPRLGRTPTGVTTRAHAHVTNGAGYLQDTLSLLNGRLRAGLGLRYDLFRFGVEDRAQPAASGVHHAGQVQPKWNLAVTPSRRWPLTLYVHYGRGISSSDARGVVRSASSRRLAATDFYQLGATHQFRRVSLITDLFWIDRSNELVYVPDDGSLEFMGPSRAYGYEAKVSVEITRRLSLNGGLTKVANAFYRGTSPRVYVDRAPHFVANAGLTLSAWRGWSGSLRMRAINHYRLDGQDPSVVASGHTVFDLSLSRRLRRGVEFSLAVDNLTDRLYYETQNYFESRLRGQAPLARIHGTPGYPLTVTAGLTFRFRGK